MDTLVQLVAIYLLSAGVLGGFLTKGCSAPDQIGLSLIGLAIVMGVFVFKGLSDGSDLRRVK